jgi:uncharacterized protein
MHKLMIVLILMATTCELRAQQTRTETTNATTPIEDSKANSDTVPNAYAIAGHFERILVLRVKYDADLLAGLEAAVEQENIRNAVILSGIGSVRNYRYHVVSNRTFPSKDILIADPTAPADIAGMNGYVIDGRVHAHITFADSDRSFGGHLEKGTNVFTFAIVTMGVLNDSVDLRRVDDKTYR